MVDHQQGRQTPGPAPHGDTHWTATLIQRRLVDARVLLHLGHQFGGGGVQLKVVGGREARPVQTVVAAEGHAEEAAVGAHEQLVQTAALPAELAVHGEEVGELHVVAARVLITGEHALHVKVGEPEHDAPPALPEEVEVALQVPRVRPGEVGRVHPARQLLRAVELEGARLIERLDARVDSVVWGRKG